MTVSECARIQGYLHQYYKWHSDERHNYFMLGNTMSICVFQRLLVAALRSIGYFTPDPWETGAAQTALKLEASRDRHTPQRWKELKATADYFTENPPPKISEIPPNCGKSITTIPSKWCGHIYDPLTEGNGQLFRDLPSDYQCPSCGKQSRHYTHKNAISFPNKDFPEHDVWVCTYAKPPVVSNLKKYFKPTSTKPARTIPSIPAIPNIEPILSDNEEQEFDIHPATPSPCHAESHASSEDTELGSDFIDEAPNLQSASP
jgi:rubredoxin